MDNLLYLRLETRNPARNHHRWYDVRLGRDLFGLWVVTIGYGRIGQGGQHLVFADTRCDAVRDVMRYYLDRRSSAPRRIGCEYRVSELSVADGVRAADWLPPEWTGVDGVVAGGVAR